ncbi:(2Fe-2S)-binding protein [Lipingzhangella rawalii]|uniref:(2Fe-2S)-binding protein n=1 Tax=Lipingzhangella rawalii TaxID=2055835 RepID=UPI00287B89C1|nr:(2Fe-2S)-binding protein [Lipingzhangella rawalii]
MTVRDIRTALTDTAELGGFFDVEVPDPPVRVVDAPWRPLNQLWSDPGVLAQRIADVRQRIAHRCGRGVGDIEPRVAASIMFQGTASRLLSPSIATTVTYGLLCPPSALYWQPSQEGPIPLRVGDTEAVRCGTDPSAAAHAISEHVLTEVFQPLAAAAREQVKLAPGLLWGNVASSVSGACRRLADLRPGMSQPALELGQALLELEPLRGRGEFVRPFPQLPQTAFFVRRTCCLYYRVPNNGKCGDCALLSEQTRQEQWRRAADVR